MRAQLPQGILRAWLKITLLKQAAGRRDEERSNPEVGWTLGNQNLDDFVVDPDNVPTSMTRRSRTRARPRG